MNFPVWDIGFAPGILIAVVATLHVFVSHFAIGTGLFLVLTERKAYRDNDQELLDFLKRHSLIFILLSVVFGAITGVGIWFVIGLINPAATSSLIHGFVFGWAIEWVFFIVEIIVGLIYYYTWDRLDRRSHLALGWVYFISAWFSLVIINGIVTFMLTPGTWLETRNFWEGFFNPTYWPSLVARTFWSFALAGVYALFTASLLKRGPFRWRITRYSGIWVLAGSVLTGLSLMWYWNAMPESALIAAQGAIPITQNMLSYFYVLSIAVIAIVAVTSLLIPRFNYTPVALIVALLMLGVFGATEWVRESVRKPYGITGYIYTNGIYPEEVDEINENGVLVWAKWISDDARDSKDPVEMGRQVFRVQCMLCHSVTEGYMGLNHRVRGWDKEFIYEVTGVLDSLRGQMPPFVGTTAERHHITEYLHTIAGDSRDYSSGKEVFDDRCGLCHTVGGYRDIVPMVEGFSADDLNETFLLMLEELAGNMPPLTVNDDARIMLADYLANLSAEEVE
ncbi:MAG: hypothetical protein GF307_06930 [candidate division Zixibacteria bacterium]|nr:hypothetical protein [candidate division Zixibacteria bacterium]